MSVGKIGAVAIVRDRTLSVTWDDGVRRTIDLAPLISERSALAPLRDASEFARVQISADGWSLGWPSQIDFGALQLRRWAEQQASAEPATA